MDYEIRVIGDDDLPAGQDWVLVEVDARSILLVKEHAPAPRLLAEVWAAARLRGRERALISH